MELARVRFADAKVDDLLATMKREHAVIVEDVLSPDCVAQVLEELEPFIAGTEPIDDDFVGKATTRTRALVTRSPASREAIAHPLVLEVANAFLSEFASNIQLNLTQIMRILPGEKAQGLHRDRYLWSRSLPPEVARTLSSDLQGLLGYTIGNGSLGYFSPSRPAQGHPDTLPPEVALGTSRRGEIEEQKPF